MSKSAVMQGKQPAKKEAQINSVVIGNARLSMLQSGRAFDWKHEGATHRVMVKRVMDESIVSCRTADVRDCIAGHGVLDHATEGELK